MPQFFVTSSDIVNDLCRIEGEDFRHLALVRRVRRGDILHLRTETGERLRARVSRITDTGIEAEVVEKSRHAPIPVEITLYMSLLKGKSFDAVIEKAVEVGVSRIVPVASERSVPRLADEQEKSKRWNRKALEAAKQSMRDSVPEVEHIYSFKNAIAAGNSGTRIIAHPGAGASLKDTLRSGISGPVSLLVGPEGGFTPEEVYQAVSGGWASVNFGCSQLRAGTAAIVLCGIIVYEFGEKIKDRGSSDEGRGSGISRDPRSTTRDPRSPTPVTLLESHE
ncbi:MAG: hypothetical protein A2W19_09565 [Spirochaetes bacterium RBG_16_49_21]|nr:MAG: hypothetical protein A2W19_09565 [Spirochaetes bacterium RBG_16_49_21]